MKSVEQRLSIAVLWKAGLIERDLICPAGLFDPVKDPTCPSAASSSPPAKPSDVPRVLVGLRQPGPGTILPRLERCVPQKIVRREEGVRSQYVSRGGLRRDPSAVILHCDFRTGS